nr:hypothetical protein [Scytonema hofmannii]
MKNDTVYLWNLTEGKAKEFRHQKEVSKLLFRPNSRQFITVENNKVIRLWDLSGKQETQLQLKSTSSIGHIKFSPDGKLLAIATDGSSTDLQLWDVTSGKQIVEFPEEHIDDIIFSPDSKQLAAIKMDGSIRFWLKMNMSSRGIGRGTPHLWRQLSSLWGLSKDSEPNLIIDRIYARSQTQDVIFIFDDVDYMPPKVLKTWLQEFWEPLITQIERKPPLTRKNAYLLMFLVDNSGSVCESNIPLIKKFDEPDYPRIPLCLPPVNPFSQNVLADWIQTVMASGMMQIPTGLTSKILFENSDNGIPEFVYEEICNYYGYSWEEAVAKWLV